MWKVGSIWSQCRGIGLHLVMIWDTLSYFPFLQLHQCRSRHVTVFLGTLWSSIKQVKSPYMFYWEQEIAPQCMHWNWGSSVGKGDVTWFSRVAAGTRGIFSSYGRNEPSKLMFVQQDQDTYLVMSDTSGISSRFARAISTLLDVWNETLGPFLLPQ